jgi:hypothetical protein
MEGKTAEDLNKMFRFTEYSFIPVVRIKDDIKAK